MESGGEHAGEITAMIMAGGRGTRMELAHPARPKPLVEVAGRPLIEIVVRQLLRAGISDVHLALRHRAAEIIQHFERLSDLDGAHLEPLVETEPLGTIGALAGLRGERRTILIVNGDLLSAIDLRAMIAHHRTQQAELTIATHDEQHRLALGEVVLGEDGAVVDYLEKPLKTYRISSGTYLVEPRILEQLEPGHALGFPELARRSIASGCRVIEFHHREPWIDVNDARDLAQAEAMLREDPGAFGLEESGRRSLREAR
jgi:NDP-sugar pyrophosphorylase family protein